MMFALTTKFLNFLITIFYFLKFERIHMTMAMKRKVHKKHDQNCDYF